MENPTDLRLGLMTRILAVLAVVFVAALAIAPAKGVFTEWRDVQNGYNRTAASLGLDAADLGIRQIWNRDLGVVDRCGSCHLGMGGDEPLPGAKPFTAHPEIPHDPAEIGCTPCHGGQGRATKKEAAHGRVKHWFEPMLPLARAEAGCGTCHTAVPVGSLDLVERGRALVERNDCLACHRIDGKGGGRVAPETMPDLSGVGLSGIPEGWHESHLARRAREPDGPFGESYGPIPAGDLAAIGEYLGTLSAMPRLVLGKRLFHALGCRGCHAVGGVGGTEGADLTGLGTKQSEELTFPTRFRGPKTWFAWQVEHLLAPAEVVSASRMPDQDLTREQAERIALYLLSLRGRDLPASRQPPDRVRAERLGEREFGTDGPTLFAVFCSACHGEDGSGRRFGEQGEVFPSVTSPDFLAVTSDDYLSRTITEGRPGSRMAAWGGSEAGLRPAEIRRIVGWLRSQEPSPPSWSEVASAAVDRDLGRRTYRRDCAVCHGEDGEGGIGPSHRAPAFGSLASPEFVYETLTGGRPGTAMSRFRELDAGTLASLIAHVRGFSGTAERSPTGVTGGEVPAGRVVYAESCAGCHGAQGEGGVGPGIGKAGFWRAADRAFVVESHARGRCRDKKGASTPAVPRAALADAAAWLETRPNRPATERPGRRVSGDVESGRRGFLRSCAGCHAKDGGGKEAPGIAGSYYLDRVNDGYLQATIVRGRNGTAMPAMNRDHPNYPRLAGEEIDDIVAFLRSLTDAPKESE